MSLAPPMPSLIVFVHGWGVTGTATYGTLPQALAARLEAGGRIVHLELGRYVSFRDEVTLPDLARAFDAALRALLAAQPGHARVACIAHSAGGPLLREWLQRHHRHAHAPVPLSHLVMLAPPNFGSALAQLGKTRLAALQAWFGGIEPGQGVLDWLELGSDASIALAHAESAPARRAAWPHRFVISGDGIDRALYDHVNAYTGETGSDGVVRLASASLDATLLRLEQERHADGTAAAPLRIASRRRLPRTAFRILPGAAHSGTRRGILAADASDDCVGTILRCLAVDGAPAYAALCRAFARENAAHQRPGNRVEVQPVPLLPDRLYIHDPHAMLVARVFDDGGARLDDVDILLTGAGGDPDLLPRGFMADRQGSSRHPGVVAFHLNLAALFGCPAIRGSEGRLLRPALPGGGPYGLWVRPRILPRRFVTHGEARVEAQALALHRALRPNTTTVIDVVLRRRVHEALFRLAPPGSREDFRDVQPGAALT